MTSSDLVTAVVGAVLGAVLSVVAWRRGPRRGTVVLAAGLAVAAGLYVVFARLGGASMPWTALELGGLAAFGAVARFGRRRPLAVAAGWFVHVAWDVALHDPAPGFVPEWYPWLCFGFDIVVALGCLALARAST